MFEKCEALPVRGRNPTGRQPLGNRGSPDTGGTEEVRSGSPDCWRVGIYSRSGRRLRWPPTPPISPVRDNRVVILIILKVS